MEDNYEGQGRSSSGQEEARAPLQRWQIVKHTLLRVPLRRGGNGNIRILETRRFALG